VIWLFWKAFPSIMSRKSEVKTLPPLETNRQERRSLGQIPLKRFVENKMDILIKFSEVNDSETRCIAFPLDILSNHSERNLGNLMTHFLSIPKEQLLIRDVQQYVERVYPRDSFEVNVIQRRTYGPPYRTFLYVRIENKITGIVLQDWVRPNQIRNARNLNKLIFWETEGLPITNLQSW
jgi:hypothetical protein